MGVVIKSFGHYLPEYRLTNAELAKRFDITEEWIVERTGILERRYYNEGATSDMIVAAAKDCLRKVKISPKDIDYIIVATLTPDYPCPSTASVVHQKIGAENAAGFDLSAACSGYIYALQIAASLIHSGVYKNILVCAAERFSSVVNPNDRKTSVICGDASGVTLLQYSEDKNNIIDTLCRLDSTYNMDVTILLGGSKTPVTRDNVSEDTKFMQFNNKRIFDNGVQLFGKAIKELMERNHFSFDEVDYIVPHQANGKMIESLATFLQQPIEKFIVNIEYTGNAGAATVPVAISEALASGKLKGGEKLLLASIGAGFTYAAGLITLGEL